jgi:hypothetical protein
MLGLNIITFAKSRDFIYKAGRRGEGTKAGLQNGPIRGVNIVSSTSSQGYLAYEPADMCLWITGHSTGVAN